MTCPINQNQSHPTSAAHWRQVKALVGVELWADSGTTVARTGKQVVKVTQDPQHGGNCDVPVFPATPAPCLQI